MNLKIDKKGLLSHLGKLRPEKKEQSVDDLMRRVSMSSALPALTGIDHEKEYLLTRQVAEHLIGKVHEPETADL